MGKIKIKLKDTAGSFYSFEQRKTVANDQIIEVEDTREIRAAIKGGALVIATDEEYDEYLEKSAKVKRAIDEEAQAVVNRKEQEKRDADKLKADEKAAADAQAEKDAAKLKEQEDAAAAQKILDDEAAAAETQRLADEEAQRIADEEAAKLADKSKQLPATDSKNKGANKA